MSQRTRHLPAWLLELDKSSKNEVKHNRVSDKRNGHLPKEEKKSHKFDEHCSPTATLPPGPKEEKLDYQNMQIGSSNMLEVKPQESIASPLSDTTDCELPENHNACSSSTSDEQSEGLAVSKSNVNSDCNDVVRSNGMPIPLPENIEQNDVNKEELSSTEIENVDKRSTSVGNENNPDTSEQNVEGSADEKDNENESNKIPRTLCIYGSSCYRRNSKHLLDFSHPGDEDYNIADNRPECKYGTSCYRKNALHKQHYKHTLPRRAKRPKKDDDDLNIITQKIRNSTRWGAKRAKKDESDSEDDYDYDDPFLNDGSSDDYDPTDSDNDTDSSEDENNSGSEEDTKRLKKEAKKFLKKQT